MKLLLVLTLAVVWVCGLGAQGWDGDQIPLPVPSTAAARQAAFSQGLLAQTPVEHLKAQALTDSTGVKVSVRLVKRGTGEDKLWELRWEPGGPWGPGTWVAFRDGLGQLREVRIILLEGADNSDLKVAQAGTWLRLVPQPHGCRMDLFLAGRLVTGGWFVPDNLLDIMNSDDSWLWAQTSQEVDWGSLLPQRRWEDEKVENLRVRIHKLLSTVPEVDGLLWWPDPRSSKDGTAANGSPWGAWTLLPGQPGEIARGMGPWGVSLWVATGILRGWNGGFLSWEALFEPRLDLPGYSKAMTPDDPTQSPAFAYDWIRNLGLEVVKTLYPSRPRTNESADVVGLPFLAPVEGAGYSLDDLPALLHLLVVTKPGQIYLASRSSQKTAEKGISSAVSFGEPAVLLPWVGNDNRVRVAVYSGPREMSLAQWLATVPPGTKGGRPDHLALIALPMPQTVELPLLPAR